MVTSATIGAIGLGGWSILRFPNGPLSHKHRLATLLVLGVTYVAISGAALVIIELAAND